MTTYRKTHYGWAKSIPRPSTKINRLYTGDPRNQSGMDGVFPLHLLSPLGKKVYDEGLRFVGRSPKHRGVSQKGMYLKWLLREGAEAKKDEENLLVFHDWLLDEGIEVKLERSWNIGGVGKRRRNETPEAYRKRCLDRRRDYIKLTIS